jgi:adenylate cyclase
MSNPEIRPGSTGSFDTREAAEGRDGPLVRGNPAIAPGNPLQTPSVFGRTTNQNGEDKLKLRIYDRGMSAYVTDFSGRIEIGRQDLGEPEPFCRAPLTDGSGDRLIIASLRERMISRRHLRLEQSGRGALHVTNLSAGSNVLIDGRRSLRPGEDCDTPIPCLIVVGDKSVRVESVDEMASLPHPTIAPGSISGSVVAIQGLFGEEQAAGDAQKMLNCLSAAVVVLQSAANSPDFLPLAARQVAEVVGLTKAAVLRLKDAEWRVEAAFPTFRSPTPQDWAPSRTMLQRVRDEKRTFRIVPTVKDTDSLMDIEALVATPILDPAGNVIGAIYGERRQQICDAGDAEISETEAKLVEVLAYAVAAGLARREQEQAAMKARVQFDQFFTHELAEQLEANPDLLSGKDAEVTVMFADIVGFSRISERLGPERTVAWINDVMETLSQCVLRQSGVVVDYIGDELLAMWGAPQPQADHAARACQAALDMLAQLPSIDARWQAELGEPTGLTIGLNSGVARVGNIGSRLKFKYGPLGNEVNVAARIRGANKALKSRILISSATAAKVADAFAVRRLCRVRVVNISEPIDIFELRSGSEPGWPEQKRKYEQGLKLLEERQFAPAAKVLGGLLEDYPHDIPTLQLLSRAVHALVSPEEFDPVWTLPAK